MKKEKSPVLVIGCILFLLLFIVLPPVFRAYIPNDNQAGGNNIIEQNKIEILKCNRIYADELFQENVSVKYLNDEIKTNTITYTKLDAVPEGYVPPAETNPQAVAEEYTYLSNIPNISNNTVTNTTTIIITDELFKANNQEERLSYYFQNDIASQKTWYEQMNYTCNILES